MDLIILNKIKMKNISSISFAVALALNMVHASSFKGSSPDESFHNMSENKNAWDYDKDASTAGAIIGFVVFGIAYIFVIVTLMIDVTSKIQEYTDLIEDDKHELASMDFDYNSEECKE